ncbi:MAG: histone deacetylase [Solirubrobacterales bacterium]|nr:histone deacetylase [Solirubrobacterales bacterium]
MALVFLDHPSSLAHDTGPHPEQAARIVSIERELDARGWLGFERIRSPAVQRADVTAVHSGSYVDAIERLCANGGGHIDFDTVVSERSFEAALHGAGGAVQLVEMLLDGTASNSFSAHRPPGHHASQARSMGFCLLNSVAIAARHAIDARGLERVMIVDWDVHHGNGTSDIFHASDQVLFVSIHQSPLYPGTGPARDVGSGPGRGFTANFPVPPGAGDAEFVSLVDHVVVPLARAFEPQLVLVSAGYDAHLEDPLAQCQVTELGYAAMTESLRRAAESLGAPLGIVLEGGYALGALARSVAATMEALAAPLAAAGAGAVGGSPHALTAIAEQARARVARWWPQLG